MLPAQVEEASKIRPTQDLDQLVEDFLSSLSPKTLEAYRSDLASFSNYLGVEPSDIPQVLLAQGPGKANSLVISYKTHLTGEGMSPATVNRRLASIRSLVKYGRVVGLINWNVEVRNLRVEQYRDTRGPGVGVVQSILDEVGCSYSRKRKRDRALIRLMFDLSLRRSSVVNLDLEDLELERNKIWVQEKGKTQKRHRQLPEPTKQALEDWLETRGMEPGPLFTNLDRAGKGHRLTGTSVYRIVRRYGAEVGVKVSPHQLRHAGITVGAELGYSSHQLKKYSGHKSAATLDYYVDTAEDIEGQIAEDVARKVK